MSQSCEFCGTMTGVHGFSFDARARDFKPISDEMLIKTSIAKNIYIEVGDWPPCACGRQSIASLVDHSCGQCASVYAKCPRCNSNMDFIRMEEQSTVEEFLADNLEEDGPWMT